MKVLFLLFFLFINIYASSLEKAYLDLNTHLDSIASKLTPDEKIKLYFLVLSTHNKILTNSNEKGTIQKYTFTTLNELSKKNTTLSQDDLKKIHMLYQALLDVKVHKTSFNFSILSALIFFLIGIGCSYIIFKKFIDNKIDEDSKLIVEDLKNKNENLSYKLENSNTLKESFFEESKKELESSNLKILELQIINTTQENYINGLNLTKTPN